MCPAGGAGKESPGHGFAVPAPFRQGGQGDGVADCHTSDIGHWFAMTGSFTWCAVERADVGSELSAASGRGSEVSEWPRSKFPASAVRQRGNFGHRNRDIRIPRPYSLLQARGLWDGALQGVRWSAFFVAGEVVFQHLQALLAEDAGGDLGVPEGIFKDQGRAVTALIAKDGLQVVVAGAVDQAA